MSLRAHLWALDQAPVTNPISKLLLIALADDADDQGDNCYPSIPRLMHRAGVARNTVRDHLRELEASGLIQVDRPETQGRGHHNRYRLILKRGQEVTPSNGERGQTTIVKGSERGQPSYPIPVDPLTKDPRLISVDEIETKEWTPTTRNLATAKAMGLSSTEIQRVATVVDGLDLDPKKRGAEFVTRCNWEARANFNRRGGTEAETDNRNICPDRECKTLITDAMLAEGCPIGLNAATCPIDFRVPADA
jgi:hypothetical protein